MRWQMGLPRGSTIRCMMVVFHNWSILYMHEYFLLLWTVCHLKFGQLLIMSVCKQLCGHGNSLVAWNASPVPFAPILIGDLTIYRTEEISPL